jgi:hypothetical protein
MFAATLPKIKKKDPRQKYPVSLRRAAKALGYHHAHIARVVSGERISPPTLRAYVALCEREAAKEKAEELKTQEAAK